VITLKPSRITLAALKERDSSNGIAKWRLIMRPDRHARTMLPIPDRPCPGLTTYDAKDPDTAFPPIEPLLPPDGAPNVLIILLDDVGFGAASTFGGWCLYAKAGKAKFVLNAHSGR
jgi:hypothetical protein